MLSKYVPKSVPSTPLPKLPSNVSSPSISQYDVCEEYEQKGSIDILPSPPSPPPQSNADTLDAEIDVLRKVYLSSRYRGTQQSCIKHRYYTLAAAQPVDGIPIIIAINGIAIGTSPTTRLGAAIWNHAITARMQANYIPTATASVAICIPSSFRVIVVRDTVPVASPPTYAGTYGTATTIPIVNSTTVYQTLGAGDLLAVRNPNTFDRYHVLYDKIINMPVTPIALTDTTAALVGNHQWDMHIDLHDSKTTFYDTTAVAIATNSIFMLIAADPLAAQGGLIGVSGNLDVTFSDAPQT